MAERIGDESLASQLRTDEVAMGDTYAADI